MVNLDIVHLALNNKIFIIKNLWITSDTDFSKYMDLYHLERYRHRVSIEGEPLYYFAVAGRKKYFR
jgi:hypothetical protein